MNYDPKHITTQISTVGQEYTLATYYTKKDPHKLIDERTVKGRANMVNAIAQVVKKYKKRQ